MATTMYKTPFRPVKQSKLTLLAQAIKRFAQRCQNTEREIRTI